MNFFPLINGGKVRWRAGRRHKPYNVSRNGLQKQRFALSAAVFCRARARFSSVPRPSGRSPRRLPMSPPFNQLDGGKGGLVSAGRALMDAAETRSRTRRGKRRLPGLARPGRMKRSEARATAREKTLIDLAIEPAFRAQEKLPGPGGGSERARGKKACPNWYTRLPPAKHCNSCTYRVKIISYYDSYYGPLRYCS